MARLRGVILAQERELRSVKRMVVVHSIFFKWKIWHLRRLREKCEADMEEERLTIARRLRIATAGLHQQQDLPHVTL